MEMPVQESAPIQVSLDDRLNPKLCRNSVVLLFIPEIGVEGIQPVLYDLRQRPGQRVVGDVETFVHWVPCDAWQMVQQVEVIWDSLYGIVINI